MKKNAVALPFAVGAFLLLAACGDDVTKTTVVEETGIFELAAGEEFPECSKDNSGEMLFAADSGLVYYCADDKWQTLNGKDGENGESSVDTLLLSNIDTVVILDTLLQKDSIVIKDTVFLKDSLISKDTVIFSKVDTVLISNVDTIIIRDTVLGLSGENGTSCTAEALEDDSGYRIVCGGDSVGVVLNGVNGTNGLNGEKGETGEKGENGIGCTLSDDGYGKVTVTCGETKTILYKALCANAPYDPAKSFCYDNGTKDSIVTLCGGKTYDLTTSFCYSRFVLALCGGKTYDPTVSFCENGTIDFSSGTVLFYTWSGSDGIYQVETGFDQGDGTHGYWYEYNDADDGGSSTITFPVIKGNADSDEAFNPIIDYCGGVCGVATMGSGYAFPYAGVAFNIGGSDRKGYDITNWKGMCIKYKSDGIAPALEIVPENETTVTGGNNYKASLSIAASETTVDLAWSAFMQESGWGTKVDRSTVLASAAVIRINFSKSAGNSTNFNIVEIGQYGECGD